MNNEKEIYACVYMINFQLYFRLIFKTSTQRVHFVNMPQCALDQQ